MLLLLNIVHNPQLLTDALGVDDLENILHCLDVEAVQGAVCGEPLHRLVVSERLEHSEPSLALHGR